jgi:hypothetical protein
LVKVALNSNIIFGMCCYNRFFQGILIALSISCGSDTSNYPDIEQAIKNGNIANEGFKRCISYRDAWLTYADPTTGLIPRNINKDKDIWNAQDAAADNYPFMVLTSAILDKEMYGGRMLEMLKTEKQLTSRVGALPDTWSFTKEDFDNASIDLDRIIFGTSEYIKDGLVPLMEYLGDSPWNDRMISMLDELSKHVDVVITIREGYGHAPLDEVNGELLQILSRVYWMTGNEKYLNWAYTIGDFYLTGEHLPTNQEYLRLRDHGCEIVSGLCELYVAAHFTDAEKKKAYQPFLYKMLDRILEVGRNDNGMFYNAINPVNGEIIEEQIADTWGYTLNGYYSVYLIDGVERYKSAAIKALENINHYRNFPWEGESADGYADAIESALNLYNRLSSDSVADWIDSEMQVMWAKQKENGIIEGWHGDGNFARTTIMYCLWKTQGITIDPWREDVVYGAVLQDSVLKFVINANKPWKGKVKFDFRRHRNVLNMPLDYPRINQFPEWFTVSEDEQYHMEEVSGQFSESYSGRDLIDGIEIELGREGKNLFELRIN